MNLMQQMMSHQHHHRCPSIQQGAIPPGLYSGYPPCTPQEDDPSTVDEVIMAMINKQATVIKLYLGTVIHSHMCNYVQHMHVNHA